MAHLPGLHQLAHRADCVLDGDLGVDTVLVVEVDVVDSEPPQRSVARLAHVFRLAAHAEEGPVLAADVPELGRDHHLVAAAANRLSHEFLVAEGAVHIGGVEEVDPQLDRAVDGRDRLLVVAASVELAHPHAAEAYRGHLELAQLPAFHPSPPTRQGRMRPGRKGFKRMPGIPSLTDGGLGLYFNGDLSSASMKHRYIADGSNRLSDPRPPSARRAHDADADRRHRRSLPALGGGPDPQAGRERSGARVRGAPRSPADRERHPRVRRRPHLASALSRRVRPADPADPGGPRMPPRRRAGLVRAQGGLAEHGNAGRSHLRHPAADRGRHPDDDDHRARHGEGDHCASPSGRGAGAEAAQGGDSMIELARRMSCVQASAIREILKVTERADVLSFAGGLPAPEAFPAGALARAHADVLANDAAAALQYGPTEGFGPLRAWVAERMTGRGLPAAPGQVLITGGSRRSTASPCSRTTHTGSCATADRPCRRSPASIRTRPSSIWAPSRRRWLPACGSDMRWPTSAPSARSPSPSRPPISTRLR